MPSPKALKLGTLVKPADPDDAVDADSAEQGQVTALKQDEVKAEEPEFDYKALKPFKPKKADDNSDEPEKELSWIEIKLVDEEDKPVAGEPYEVILPDNSLASGTTDDKGEARIEGFDPGSCKISFPNLDKTVWEDA